MRSIALFTLTALGVAGVALGQPMNETAPQPQPGQPPQSETPAPPSPSDPSMTTMQQPISGNSSASSPADSMAPNSAEPSKRLAALLPEGVSSKEACRGFRSEYECAAALHASHDLDIPFDQLKPKVTASGGLEDAIHELKPDADAAGAAHRAEQQAKLDLQSPRG
jgi:hypothetical protein